MQCLNYFIIFCSIVCFIEAQEAIIEVNTKQAAYHVSDNYISFSIDAEDIFKNGNMRDEKLELVQMLAPAYIRITGLSSMQITPKNLSKFNDWFKASNITPVITIDYEPTKWHPRETIEFLGMCREIGMETCIWQFGQKLNSSIIPKYSEDILTFDNIVDVLTDSGRWGTWKVAAADMELDWDTKPYKLRAYYSKISPKANIMFIRTIQNMVDDSIEEEIENDDEEALRWSYSQKTDMWLSRPLISPSIQKQDGCCKQCVDEGLRYAKSLGEAGMHGYKVLLQDINLSTIGPNLIYFITLLHKQLMGATILDVATLKNDDELIQFYAHCTTNLTSESAGSITIFGINMEEEEMSTLAKIMHKPKDGNIMEYILTVKDQKILINNEPASVQNEPFPQIKPTKNKKSIVFTLPPKSIGFWVISTNSKLCSQHHNSHKHTNTNKIFKLRRTSATILLEELILDSLKNSDYHFLKDLNGKFLNSIKHVENKKEIGDAINYKNNLILCDQKEEIENMSKKKIKYPLAKLLTENQKLQIAKQQIDRSKREIDLNRKLPKKVQESKSAKKIVTTVYTSGLPKRNSAEHNIFQQRDNFALPTGDVFAEIGNNNDYEYVDADADDQYAQKNQYAESLYNQPQYIETSDDNTFNTEQGLYMARDPKYKQLFPTSNFDKNDFFELGAEFRSYFEPQSNRENPQIQQNRETPQNFQFRFSRSIQERDSKILRNDNQVAHNNISKNLLSKRKQKLYKKGVDKKGLLKKYDVEKNNYGQKDYVSRLINNDVDTKSDTKEIRPKRSLKNKRKSQTFTEYENQKAKREIETTSLDTQADKQITSFQNFNDKISSKLSEIPNSEITDKLKDAQDRYTALQNHLQETKNKLLSKQKSLLIPSSIPFPAQNMLELSKSKIHVPDIFKKDSHIQNLLENDHAYQNPLNTEIWPLLNHKSITDKIEQDLKSLQERLSQALHTKDVATKSLVPEDTEEEMNNEEENTKSELYQPSVTLSKLLKGKRHPLYLKHKEKLAKSISNEQVDDTELTDDSQREKRSVNKIIQESSKENMIFSNSVEQDDNITPHYDEIAQEIIIIDKVHNDRNSKEEGEKEIIIQNISEEGGSKEEIVFATNDNSTSDVIDSSNNHSFGSFRLIDDMAHKLTNLVTFVQSKLKHWLL